MTDPAFQMRLQDQSGTALFTFTDGMNCIVDGDRNGWNISGTPSPDTEWVEESVNLIFRGTLATARANLQAVERELYQAQRWNQQHLGYRVYLAVKIGGDTTWWRSEISGGSMTRFEIRGISTGTLAVTLKYQRRNYFEGDEEYLPLSNLNGTDVLTGINIYPRGDGAGTSPDSYCNYVEIDGADIKGSLPTPPQIQVFNNYNSRIYDMRLAHHVRGITETTWFSPLIEGENNASASVTNSKPSDSSKSGGKYISFSVNSSTLRVYGSWTLPDMEALNSRWFKVLAMASMTNMVQIQMTASFWPGSPVTQVAYGPLVNVSGATSGWKWYDFGSIQLAPWLAGQNSIYPLDLTLFGKTNGAATLNIDAFMLFPADEYRYLTPRGYGTPYLTFLVDSGFDNQVWVNVMGYKTGYYVGFGKILHLIPGRSSRIYFAYETNDWPAQVFLTYRPRRVTL